jgi:DNA mismatch repair protein MutS
MTREPAPFSILLDSLGVDRELEDSEAPDFFADLNLDQVFDAIAGASREYNLAAFFRSPLPAEAAVTYRQDAFRDLESGLAEPVAAFAEQIRRARSHLMAAQQRHARYSAAAWFLDAGDIYCAAVMALENALSDFRPASLGFRRCSAYLAAPRPVASLPAVAERDDANQARARRGQILRPRSR